MGKLLQILGIAWSAIALLAGVAFFFGGEWNDWKEIKQKVLVDGTESEGPELPDGIEVSNNHLNKLKGNLLVTENRWDGDPISETVHTDIKYCPEGWYVIGLKGIDTDTGGYCANCISHIEFVCRKL